MEHIDKFRFWVQKVLPLIYDDSISYYEFLCKVCVKLNEVIKNENELSDAFIDLKQYVEDNVSDLEDKIVSVINQMIEDGYFDDILRELVKWDETPLSDTASGSAGESDLISRGDHRHPLNPEVVNLLNRIPLAAVSDLNELTASQAMIVAYTTETLHIPTENRNGFCLHYASSANYAAQLAMGVGDSNIYTRKKSGGTWGEWEIVYQVYLEELDTKVLNLQDDVDHTNYNIHIWNTEFCGKLLFLGNSYGKNSNYPDVIKWPNRVADMLGLGAENTDWFNVCQPSHSLYGTDGTSGAFITDLQSWVANNADEVSNIGGIVLVAGINDARSPRASYVPSKLSELAIYIKATFPNAIMYCGYTGWIDEAKRLKYNNEHPNNPDTHGIAGYRNLVAKYYMESPQYGWNYLNGVENAFHVKDWMVDHIHPDNYGEIAIANSVKNALLTGATSVSYRTNGLVVPIPVTITDYDVAVNNGGFLQWINNSSLKTQWESLEFTFSPAYTMAVGQIYTIGKVSLPYSNSVDFGNQIIMIRTDTDNQGITGMIARPYIEPADDTSALYNINLQIKGFCDGSASKNVRRIVRFVAMAEKGVITD